MSYSACIHGGMCTGCMRCYDALSDDADFDLEDDYFAEVKEVLDFYDNKPYELFLSLVRYADMFREVNNEFYQAAKNGAISDNAITLVWSDGSETYEKADVEDWCAEDFGGYLNFWHKEFSVMSEIVEKERAAMAATKRDSRYKNLNPLVSISVA